MRCMYRFSKSILLTGVAVIASAAVVLGSQQPADLGLHPIAAVESRKVWQVNGEKAFLYKSKMAIDADGAPNTYHPVSDFGIDDLFNGGTPGNWWAVVTDTGEPDGLPIFQGPDDPAPGYYVSTTSLMDLTRPVRDPARYVDATKIPFFVLPMAVIKAGDAHLGDFAVVYNSHNNRLAYAIFADEGPPNLLGEGSIALANQLKINPNARNGGIADGIVFLVFPRSGNEKPRSVREINREGSKLFKAWGGLKQLRALVPVL